MAGLPISLSEIVHLIQKGVELYNKIKDAPEQIQKIGKRMGRLERYLIELGELIDPKKNQGGLASLKPAQVTELEEITKDIRAEAKQVYDLLYRWEHNMGPKGVEFRFGWVAHAVYAWGSSPDKLDTLADNIDHHLDDINRFVNLLNAAGNNVLLQQLLAVPPRKRSPSPGSANRSYAIIFVDGYNDGRSAITEAYCRLVREWTLKGKKRWTLKYAHSAGIFIKNRGNCSVEIEKMGLKLVEGNTKTKTMAVEALFDNKLFSYPAKAEIRNHTLGRRPRGLTQKLFSNYDLVVAFSNTNLVHLLKLRELLIQKNGVSARPKGKGRIVLLGEYANKTGDPQIFEPFKDRSGNESREKWNVTVSNIKLACKGLLKKETGWEQP